MIVLTYNIIFVGDIPRCKNYIDGNRIKPADTQFKADNKLILYFDKIPKNIDQYLKYSTYPIHIFENKIPKNVPKGFQVVNNTNEISFIQILQNIFYNPDRDKVYNILLENKPPIVPLHMWLQQNILRVHKEVPNVMLILDEYVVPDKTKTNACLNERYYYSLISYGIKNITNMRKLKWLKKKEN